METDMSLISLVSRASTLVQLVMLALLAASLLSWMRQLIALRKRQPVLARGDIEFLDPDNPRHLMRRLRRLFIRARPDQNEVNILRGILSAVERDREKDT